MFTLSAYQAHVKELILFRRSTVDSSIRLVKESKNEKTEQSVECVGIQTCSNSFGLGDDTGRSFMTGS